MEGEKIPLFSSTITKDPVVVLVKGVLATACLNLRQREREKEMNRSHKRSKRRFLHELKEAWHSDA